MKLLFSIALLVITFVDVYSQKEDTVFKLSNTIYVETGHKPDSIFLAWGKHLALNGFSIEKSDINFHTLTTGPKDTSKFNSDYIINCIVQDDGSIKIKMKWRVKSSWLAGTSSTDYYNWEYATNKGNVKYVMHEDLIKVIARFGNYRITYSKE